MEQYLQTIALRGQQAQQLTDDALRDAQYLLAQGKKNQALKTLDIAMRQLRIIKQEITQISSDARIEAQSARAHINSRGRTVAIFLGRGKWGNAIRSGISQGRANSRTNLAQEQSMVTTESRNAQLFIDQCIVYLDKEKLRLS